MIEVIISNWPLVALVAIVGLLATNYYQHGLQKYPGPVLAKFTNFWKVYANFKGQSHQNLIKLHQKHGQYVRTGPNTISISDPSFIPQIYGVNRGFTKSNSYRALRAMSKGRLQVDMFTTNDERAHASMKRAVAGTYSLGSLTGYEPQVDDTIKVMINRLDEEFGGGKSRGKPANLAMWLQYYAFDVIQKISFSDTVGFLNSGTDVDGMISQLHSNLRTSSLYFQVPWLTQLWNQNPIRSLLKADNIPFPDFVLQKIEEHKSKFQDAKINGNEESLNVNGTRDFVYRFLAMNVENPGSIDQNTIFNSLLANVNAGSDTTAAALRAIIYYVLKDHRVMNKLLNEVRNAKLSYPVKWKESQQLPYLDACIKEALRMHPPAGFGFDRVVPKQGLLLADGNILVEGTVVSMSPWVIHRDTSTFGPETQKYIPERWLKLDDETLPEYEARLSIMKGAFLTFGWGKRVCLGRNISLLEIYKLIPTLFREYDIGLVSDRDWKTWNSFVVFQSDMNCWLERRAK